MSEKRSDTEARPAAAPSTLPFPERFGKANELLSAGDLDGAITAYEALIVERPRAGMVLVKLADAKRQFGDRTAAFDLLERAREIAPDVVWPHVGLAKLHDDKKDYAGALVHLERAVVCENVPTSVRTDLIRHLLTVAHVAVTDQQFQKAENWLRQALTHAHFDPGIELRVRSDLADLFIAENRPERAMQALSPMSDKAGQKMETLLDRLAHSRPGRIVVADARQDENGYALRLLEALRLAAPELGRLCLRFVNADSPDVQSEIDSLAWDTGFTVEIHHGTPAEAFEGSACFLAVARRTYSGLQRYRQEAAQRSVPAIIAIETCTDAENATDWVFSSSARDPANLAGRITKLLS